VRGFESTYRRRHRTLNLFAALEVATGAIHTQTMIKKRHVEFIEFMDKVVADVRPERGFMLCSTTTASTSETMNG